MIYLLDGSNLLGQLRLDRHADESKRFLVRAAASVARTEKAKLICVFDGAPPPAFATCLGAVTVKFAAPRTADEVIFEEASRRTGEPLRIVSSDAELVARVRRRNVTVISAREFERMIGQTESAPATGMNEDWERYFSDPKNRNV